MSKNPVTDISIVYNVALVTVDNLPTNLSIVSEIFNEIAKQNINVDMISQAPPFRGAINLSFSIPADDVVKALSVLNSFKGKIPGIRVEVDTENTKLSVFGENMKNLPGVAARLFTILAGNGIEIKLVTTSEVDISYLIYENDVDKAIQAIKSGFDI